MNTLTQKQRYERMTLKQKTQTLDEILWWMQESDWLLQKNVLQLYRLLHPLSEESCILLREVVQEMNTLGQKLKTLSEQEQSQAIKDMMISHQQIALQESAQADVNLLPQLQ